MNKKGNVGELYEIQYREVAHIDTQGNSKTVWKMKWWQVPYYWLKNKFRKPDPTKDTNTIGWENLNK